MQDIQEYLPRPQRVAVMFIVVIASVMQILDTTIANVALPHMQSALGASQEQISWVITSYIVATAITIPATGFLEGWLGRRNLFLMSIAGFTISSALCGIAGSMSMMIAARVLQGVFGAAIMPLGQSILFDVAKPEERAQSMAIWGLGLMIGPVCGPLLGGWLTENFSWRWVFFINVPIGIMVLVSAASLLDRGKAVFRVLDWRGYAMIAIGIASFQLALDRGTENDWFDSVEIIVEFGIAAAAFWMFTVHTMTAKAPLIARDVLKDRNILIACVLTIIISGSMMAGATFLSLMLQSLFGYGTIDAGLMAAPRGLAMAICMPLVSRLMAFVDSRIMIALGLSLVTVGFVIMSGFSLQMDNHLVIIAGVIQGLGFGFVMIPTNLLALSTLNAIYRTEGASLMSLARSIGGSVVIALGTASVARTVQISHNDIGANVTPETMPMLNAGLFEQLGIRGEAVMGMINMEVNRQSLMIAYIDIFWVMIWVTAVTVPMLFFTRKIVFDGSQDRQMAADAH